MNKEDLKQGEIYVIHLHKNPEWDSIFLSGGGMSNTDRLYLNQPKYNKNSGEWVPSGGYEIREATKEEKIWLKACSKADKFIEWISCWGVMFKPATEAEYLAQQYPKSLFTKPKFKIGDEVKVCRKEEDKNRWGYLKNKDTTEQIAALGGRRGKILERKIHNGRNYYRIDLFFISEDCLTPVNVVPEPSFEKIPILDINGQYVGGYDPYLVEEMKTFSEDYKVVQKSPKNKINECVNKVKSVEIKLVQPKKVVYF